MEATRRLRNAPQLGYCQSRQLSMHTSDCHVVELLAMTNLGHRLNQTPSKSHNPSTQPTQTDL